VMLTRSISLSSLPNTLMPTGVRTPVVSMSIRVRIGGAIAIWYPGIRSAASRSRDSSASVRARASGHTAPNAGFTQSGAYSLYQRGVYRVGHSSCGRNVITVSIMSSCAGSVAVSARPTLPCTDATSAKLLIVWSCRCSVQQLLPRSRRGLTA